MIIASNQGRRNFIFFEKSVTVELGVLLNLWWNTITRDSVQWSTHWCWPWQGWNYSEWGHLEHLSRPPTMAQRWVSWAEPGCVGGGRAGRQNLGLVTAMVTTDSKNETECLKAVDIFTTFNIVAWNKVSISYSSSEICCDMRSGKLGILRLFPTKINNIRDQAGTDCRMWCHKNSGQAESMRVILS